MSEIYTSNERILIFSVTYGVSLIASAIFLYSRVDGKNISIILFILCVLYVSFFFFLVIIATFDLVFTSSKGFEKLGKNISKFYEIFSLVDKIIGNILLYFIISFMESGYYNYLLRFIDRMRRDINNIIKCKVETIIQVLIRLAAIIIFLVLLIQTKQLDFKTAKDYFEIISDCYSIIEIYSCVGFFIYQIFIDCKRKRDAQLIRRYYRYSIIKIIENTEKYTKKLKNSYDVLYRAIKNLDEKDTPRYYKFLEVQEKNANEFIKINDLNKNYDEIQNLDNNNNNDNNNDNNNANNNNNFNNNVNNNNFTNNNSNYYNNFSNNNFNNSNYINNFSNNNFANSNYNNFSNNNFTSNIYGNYNNNLPNINYHRNNNLLNINHNHLHNNYYNQMNGNIFNSNNLNSNNNMVYIPDFSNFNKSVYDKNYNRNNLENNSRQNNIQFRDQIHTYKKLPSEQTQSQSQRKEIKKI